MEDADNVILSIFMQSLNPGFCVKILEYADDPKVEFVMGNNEFYKLIGHDSIEHKVYRLSELDKGIKNTYVSSLIKRVLKEKKEIVTECRDNIANKEFRVKCFIPAEGYVSMILADITEYVNAKNDTQTLYLKADQTAQQLKYQVDLLKATQDELKRINRIHEIMFLVSSDGFFYKNYESGIFYAADSFYELFTHDGIRPADNSAIVTALYERDAFHYLRVRENAIKNHDDSMSKEVRLLDGNTWLDTNLKFNYDKYGKLYEEIGFFRNITVEKKQQEELAYHAYFDTVTGMMNRSYFTKLLDEDIQKIKQENGEIQIIYIDIDDFKKTNDSVGFRLGDKLIMEFSRRLRKLENDRIRVARFDSDEFVISIYNGTRNEANNICNEIRSSLTKAMEIGSGMSCLLTASMGISEYPTHGKYAIDVISNADIAVHHVKNMGKNGTAFFDVSMLEKLLSNAEMEKNISYALENEKFIVYYQPQYYTESGKLRGFEALVRMRDEQESIVSPGKFIPVAESNGSIIGIGQWVLERALKDYMVWNKEYGFDGIISINISVVQFRQPKFEDSLYDAISKYGVPPEKVEIEITESVFSENQSQLIETVKHIRSHGIKVSLDDFGTGYSSLAYLKDIPADTLKIDKTFVDSIGKEQKSDMIINSIVELMRNLGLEIIAEGVETKEQFEILKKLQCHDIQGFLLGKPMSSKDALDVIKTRK